MFFSFMFYFGSYYPMFYNAQVEIIVRNSAAVKMVSEANDRSRDYSPPQRKIIRKKTNEL